jgi:hypothetical protein
MSRPGPFRLVGVVLLACACASSPAPGTSDGDASDGDARERFEVAIDAPWPRSTDVIDIMADHDNDTGPAADITATETSRLIDVQEAYDLLQDAPLDLGTLPDQKDQSAGEVEAEILQPAQVWPDPATGLEWQLVAPFDTMSWEQAKTHCLQLPLNGGGWHLPTLDELRTIIRDCPATVVGGECNVSLQDCLLWQCRGDSCMGCPFGGGNGLAGCYWPQELSGKCASYWASEGLADKPDLAWHIGFQGAYISPTYQNAKTHVRCVR